MQSATYAASENLDVSDNELINQAKAGIETGFEQLIQRYQDRLFRAIHNDVGCPHAAEDIVQEAFVKAFLRLDSFQQQSKFYTWLYRIAINLRITHYRKNSRPVYSLESVDQSRLSHRVDPSGSPDDIALRVEARQQVRDALKQLADQHRRILVLRDYEQLDYQSISEILNVRLGTVRSRLHRARCALKDEIHRKQRQTPAGVKPARPVDRRQRGDVKPKRRGLWKDARSLEPRILATV
jgi:RNA polymerase sigma-70 factor (ECF subfamily)